MKAVVFGGAEVKDYTFAKEYIKDAYIVACDGGMKHCRSMGLKPDIIVGDFDSVSNEDFEFFKNKDIPIRQFDCKKDWTDMELGIDAAIESGADDIVIIGGIGSRLDHTMANCQLLYQFIEKGIRGRLANENNVVELIDKEILLEGKKGDIVSLIPMTSEVLGVTSENLEYPLNDTRLYFGNRVIAVSNVMTEDTAKVSIKSGLLYVFKSRD